jgi:hypothetical protein
MRLLISEAIMIKTIIRLFLFMVQPGWPWPRRLLGAQLTEDEINIDIVKNENSDVFVVNIQRVQDLFFFEQEVLARERPLHLGRLRPHRD